MAKGGDRGSRPDARMLDLAVIGAGPCGIGVGAAAQRAGLAARLFDKGPVAASLLRYPLYMTFFSTADKLEIEGVPFVTAGDKPTRREALAYYRRVAEYFDLDVRAYHEVRAVQRLAGDNGFELDVGHATRGESEKVRAHHVVFATGYFEAPNLLDIAGEDLPHVAHFYAEPHPYWRQQVVIVGGGNSAVEAALEIYRVGGRVTIVHFLSQFDRGVKPWLLPDITNRVKEGAITVRWQARVVEIRPTEVVLRSEPDGRTQTIPADFVLALTGYRADLSLLRSTGVFVDDATGRPHHAAETMETNVPGLYIAGVLAAGLDANRIFIENGRVHGGLICRHIKTKPPRVASGG